MAKSIKRHFLETLSGGKLTRTKLKDWARENQKEFPRYSFTNNSSDIPTTHEIRDLLIKKFNLIMFEEPDTIILRTNKYGKY